MTAPQRTPEWHAERVGRVTGSIVGAALGLDPTKKPDDIIRMMVRETLGADRETSDFLENTIFAHGRHYESGAVIDFEMETRLKVTSAPFCPYEDWLGASPDGYVSDGNLVEIKSPFGKRKDLVPVFKTLREQPHYHAQMQIEMLCADRQACHFYQWAPNGTSLRLVKRDDEWLAENLPLLRAFHASYLEALADPDEHLSPLRAVVDTPDALMMVREYDELSEAIELATERKKELLAAIVSAAGDRNALVAGRKLTKVEKEGAVSYAKVVKEKLPGLDLSAWRGKPSSFWKLS